MPFHKDRWNDKNAFGFSVSFGFFAACANIGEMRSLGNYK